VSYNVVPAIAAALIQWAMGFGAAISMVAGTTYLALARPETRSSVAASQRFAQQLGGAISVAMCGYLFGALGPTWTGKPPTMNRMKAAEMDGWPGSGNKLMRVLIVQER
jgi:MFS family permease